MEPTNIMNEGHEGGVDLVFLHSLSFLHVDEFQICKRTGPERLLPILHSLQVSTCQSQCTCSGKECLRSCLSSASFSQVHFLYLAL